MPRRSRTGKPDVNQMAANLIDAVSGELPAEEKQDPSKNPHAVALGRLGGLKGGPARAKSVSAERRSEIARLANKQRWSKRKPHDD